MTLEQGHGQTISFSARPDRIVGASPTPQFLDGLGFFDDNPPNAALVVETAPGETDAAVVEPFAPRYDPVSQRVTYEVETPETWEAELGMGFREAPADLAALAPSFGSAQLFIDDCLNMTDSCLAGDGHVVGEYDSEDMCWNYSLCIPCDPYYHVQLDRCATKDYWENIKCNEVFDECQRDCSPYWFGINLLCPEG